MKNADDGLKRKSVAKMRNERNEKRNMMLAAPNELLATPKGSLERRENEGRGQNERQTITASSEFAKPSA
jgi:hypothetical protein